MIMEDGFYMTSDIANAFKPFQAGTNGVQHAKGMVMGRICGGGIQDALLNHVA